MCKLENVNGWNGREWRAYLPGTCGFENRPLVFPHRAIEFRGKNCLYWVKIWNGDFDFYFWTIYRNNFKMWVFYPIVLISIKNQTNIMSCLPNAIGSRSLKSCYSLI